MRLGVKSSMPLMDRWAIISGRILRDTEVDELLIIIFLDLFFGSHLRKEQHFLN